MLAFALTARLTSPERVAELGDSLAQLLPAELGAPDAVSRLVEAGIELTPLGGLLALLPMTLYGEGLRRALLRFSTRREGMTGWRGRLAALPVLLMTPVLLYPLLLTVPVMADLAETGGLGANLGRIAVGFYAMLAALTIPLAWGFQVVGAGRVRWSALAAGALFTAACVSGFLQGFVLFLALPLDLGAPFGGLVVVGGVVAVGLWLFLLHLVVLCGWLVTQSLDELLTRPSAPTRAAQRAVARAGRPARGSRAVSERPGTPSARPAGPRSVRGRVPASTRRGEGVAGRGAT